MSKFLKLSFGLLVLAPFFNGCSGGGGGGGSFTPPPLFQPGTDGPCVILPPAQNNAQNAANGAAAGGAQTAAGQTGTQAPRGANCSTAGLPQESFNNLVAARQENLGSDHNVGATDNSKLPGGVDRVAAEATAKPSLSSKDGLTKGNGLEKPDGGSGLPEIPSFSGLLNQPNTNSSGSTELVRPETRDSGIKLGDHQPSAEQADDENSQIQTALLARDGGASFKGAGKHQSVQSALSGLSGADSGPAKTGATGKDRSGGADSVNLGTHTSGVGELRALAADQVGNGASDVSDINLDQYLARVGTTSLFEVVKKRYDKWENELAIEKEKERFKSLQH